MKKLIAAALVLCTSPIFAGDVVIPLDGTPFKVKQVDTVRIEAKGIAGTSVAVKVTGPARETINTVRRVKNGRPLLGPGDRQVDVAPTGAGKVTVEVTISPPNGKPETKTYEFDVE